ncbi:hypothetical protein FNV43_RR01951 [Rhamnella rubrinervis]|uniref:Uncharacterized protein n=1 Tax=Rhamnella rubrinervis TaxID=2594499 RepID=A0A8K0MTC5_9ROSA|nr:hypothetical protein FNV43_RR01951 [Rhamnella rubrinervis]
MDWKKSSMDLSSFLLLEDSADSEVDCFAPHYINTDRTGAAKEEDAESCSCDCEEASEKHGIYEVSECMVEEEEDGDKGDEDKDDEDKDDDDGCWESWRSCKMGLSNAGLAEEEESKFIAGMDDKLFWETCLAVGYP